METKAAELNHNAIKGQIAKVVDLDDDMVTVKVQRHAMCEKCGVCNLGIVSSNEKTVKVENTLNASEGDYVSLGIKSGAILSASFILYVVPLLTFFLGLVLGNIYGDEVGMATDLFSGLLGITFLVITFVIIFLYDKRVRGTNKFKPYIIRIVDENEAKEMLGQEEDGSDEQCH